MLETVEVTEQPIVELKDYEKIENNKILKGLSDEDYIQVINYFNEKFPVFYVSKNKWDKNPDKFRYDNLNSINAKDYYIFINPLCRKDIFDGKIDLVKNLCEKNYKFLDHMFRYNKTLKAFKSILVKGHFEVLEQYEPNIIWHYFKDNHNSYTEKKGNYIGHLESRSKLEYFPTNYEFQYKALPYVCNIEMKDTDFIRKSTINFIQKYAVTSDKRKLYESLISMGRYDIIDECFKINILCQNGKDNGYKVVIADLFAGEGEWLNTFKKLTVNKDVYIIANEIEKNRMLECKSKKFNNVIWGAYEELNDKIPKDFIDIMLFNPPYGETDGQRNVVRFFDMLLEDKYMEEYNNVVIGVFNEKDLELILPKLSRYCDVKTVFKMENNEAESERLKQYCVIFTIEKYPNSEYYINDLMKQTREMMETDKEISFNFYRKYNGKNINARFDTFNVTKNPEMYKSNINSDAWREFENSVTIETFQGKTIKLAEKPRNIGAAANLISSGLINGEIEGEHEHCIAAGITEQITRNVDAETGNIIVTKKSAPFLSVLTGGNIIQITQSGSDPIEIKEDGTVVVA